MLSSLTKKRKQKSRCFRIYTIELTPEAEDDLRWFYRRERNIIVDGIKTNNTYRVFQERDGYSIRHSNATINTETMNKKYG
jgi:hypothetical protein